MNQRRNLEMLIWCVLTLVAVGCGTANNEPSISTSPVDKPLEQVTEKGPVKLTVRFSPRTPRLSELVEMDIEVTTRPNIEIKPPAFGQAVGDFVVRDYTERKDAPMAANPELLTRRFQYKLEPMSAGRHLIRSLAIDFVDIRPDSEQKGQASVIESEPFEVNVTSELGDQVPNLANLDPMLPPQPLNKSRGPGRLLIAVLTGVVVLIVVWLRLRRRARTVEARRKTPEEIAHEAFAALLAEDLPGKGLFKEFYLRLTGIVRQYIEGKTGIRAPEQTTEEFLRAMRSRNLFSVERSGRLREFLEAADMVKFAGQQPDNEQIELSIVRAREFVDLRSSNSTLAMALAEGA